MRFNTQIADLTEDQSLCQKVYENYCQGQSVRHIANKYGISDYAVRKLAKYWQEKENRTEEVR